VTFNSVRFIEYCLHHVFEQDYAPLEIIVVDNASEDGTQEILGRRVDASKVRVVLNHENRGFAGGQNQAIAISQGEWILTLNPDVRLSPNFVSIAVGHGSANALAGSVSGKLLAMNPDFTIPHAPVLDSTGIYFTPNLRHFDRGSRQADDGRYNRSEYVFGVTGAAGLYRRKMIEDLSIDGEFFDSDFFAYREDADVAWRAQLLGWKCLYVPDAIAYHVRSVLPDHRRSVVAIVNMHSVKNRFLMRIKNVTFRLYVRHFVSITLRDTLVVAGCLLREWSSLPAFVMVIKLFPRAWAKRRNIMQRRRVTEDYMGAWFVSSSETKR